MEERGRRLSAHGGQHISPVPSQDNYHDALTGLDPSISQNTFSTGRFNTSNNDISFSQAQEQPYMTNYMPQMATAYMNQSYNSDFMLPGQDYSNFQDLSMNQFANSISAADNPYASNVNPADLSKMSSPDNPSPRLLSPEVHNSAPQSPSSTNGQFHTPSHSRNTSLDPNSAYADWQGMQFRQHQRTPSDVSDVSSVNNSPYLRTVEIEGSHSPMFAPQQDTSTFGIDNFTIGETSQPGSSYVSPRLMPQQQDGLGLNQDVMLNQGYQVPQEVYVQDPYQSMHNRNHSIVSDIGQADQFAPPTINIEPAPVSRQASFGPQGQEPDALSPPANSSRGRNRSQSDVTFARPLTARSVSPGPGRQGDPLSRSHSPSPMSRSSSPGVAEGRISKDRRASTSAINSNNREYILDLADPNRPSGSNGNSARVQKHPATFQCSLCPKRFTRAYNLRSHLRTHTDERPFVCTVCGKAFARQHDRKRHEGLHSGEKKFVCKGELSHSPGQTWGCGRRFARADALGRHFRSEAGRVCIKPLLDEEAAERRQNMMMEQVQQQAAMLQPVPQQMMVPDMNNFALPAALLAQYPALQNIDWSALQQTPDDGELSDMGVGGFEDAGGLSDSGTYGHTGQW